MSLQRGLQPAGSEGRVLRLLWKWAESWSCPVKPPDETTALAPYFNCSPGRTLRPRYWALPGCIPDLQKWQYDESVLFKLRSFGMICYVAGDSWYTAKLSSTEMALIYIHSRNDMSSSCSMYLPMHGAACIFFFNFGCYNGCEAGWLDGWDLHFSDAQGSWAPYI